MSCNVENCECSGFISPQKTPKENLPDWVIEYYVKEYDGYVYHFINRCSNCGKKSKTLKRYDIQHSEVLEKAQYCKKCREGVGLE